MATKIDQKITGYNVVQPDDKRAAAPVAASAAKAPPMAEVIQMHESLERPETLVCSTFKIKSP
ncbi:MAG: NrdJb, partial [Rhodanobacter sp.]